MAESRKGEVDSENYEANNVHLTATAEKFCVKNVSKMLLILCTLRKYNFKYTFMSLD